MQCHLEGIQTNPTQKKFDKVLRYFKHKDQIAEAERRFLCLNQDTMLLLFWKSSFVF